MDDQAGPRRRRAARRRNHESRSALRWVRHHKKTAATLLSVAVASLVGLLVADAYNQVKDAAGGPALSVDAVSMDSCPGGRYLLPRDVVPRLPRYDVLDTRWTYEHGGAVASGGPVQVVVQGRSEDAVVLLDMSVRVVNRRPAGDLVAITKCQGAGDLYPRFFNVDLDEGEFPVVRSVAGDREIPGDGGRPAIDFPYTVSRSDVELFWIIPQTATCLCAWEATIRWSSGGDEGSTAVRFDSRPFATAATTGEQQRFDFLPDGRLRAVREG